MQMITYNEFLPVVLGQNAINFYKLQVLSGGFSNYDPNVNPSIISEFSSAAFRFGHSLINGRFTMITSDSKRSSFMLKDNFFSPARMRDGQLDMIVRGLIGRSAQRFDPFCHADLRNNLYKSKNEASGSDLPAINIQRGRDHGIPGYVHYLKLCFEDVSSLLAALTHSNRLFYLSPLLHCLLGYHHFRAARSIYATNAEIAI